MSVATIFGAAQLSNCGSGLDGLIHGLENGPNDAQWICTRYQGDEPRVPVLKALPQGIDDIVAPRQVRRLDDFAKNFIFTARMAMIDSGLEMPAPERIGVVTGTSSGSLVTSFKLLDDILLVGDDAVSPFKFTTSVNNASATSVATYLGARGPCLTVLGFRDITLNVVRTAMMWLDEGRIDLVIAAVGDEFHPMIGYGLESLGGWSPDGRVRPLDFERCSYVPGETCVALVLGREGNGFGRARITAAHAINDFDDVALDQDRSVLLGADGRLDTAKIYSRLAERVETVASYSALWGGNLSADAMQLAVALAAIERGRWFGLPPDSGALESMTLPHGGQSFATPVDCVSANSDGSGSIITLEK